MTSEPRRRRRSGDEPPGGLPLLPLIVLVILAGLLLGGVLAHFFGKSNSPAAPTASNETAKPAPSPAHKLPSAAPSPTPSATSPSPTASTTHSPSPAPSSTPTPKPKPSPSATTAPTAKETVPSAKPTAAPTPTPAATHVPAATHAPAATNAPAEPPSETQAVGIVRSYLSALARGDRASAASYLAHGSPSESFMNSSSHVDSVRVATVGAQQYQVTAAVQSGGSEYYVTFTVGPGTNGLAITDHYTIKPR